MPQIYKLFCKEVYWCSTVILVLLLVTHWDMVMPFLSKNLTHWGRDEIDAILLATLSNAFSWMKMHELCLRFHWGLFIKFKLIIFHYNMVGVVVAMVISTMHEKSCIDSHNARKFEKKVPTLSHSHISQSQWWNCRSITVMNFLSYHNYTTQLLRKLFLTKLSQDSYLSYLWFH